MLNQYVILTGTLSGIGNAAARLLLDLGYCVYGIARREPEASPQGNHYRHVTYDLANTAGIDAMMEAIVAEIRAEAEASHSTVDSIVLINNAAVVEPLGSIADCSHEAITLNFAVNLHAPAVLSAAFLRHTRQHSSLRRRIVNVTSGSAVYANPGMSIYSAAKAGLNMLTRCMAMDHPDADIAAFDPGMADTPMQETARNRPAESFAMSEYFRGAAQSGQLLSPDTIAARLVRMLDCEWRAGEVMHHSEFQA